MSEPPAAQGPPATSADSRPPRTRKPAWQRWGLRLAVALLLYTLVGFFLVPRLVRSIATGQIETLLDRSTVIESVRFNPYTFLIEIGGLRIEDPDGEILLGWRNLRIDFQFTSIFRGPWRLGEFTLMEPRVRAQMNPDYSFNFSDLLKKFAEAPETPGPGETGPPPPLLIDSLTVRGAGLIYADLTPSEPFHRLVQPVDLTITNFSTLPGATNSVLISGRSDAGEQFTWSGQFLLDPPEITGRFELQGLQVTQFAPFYQDLTQFVPRDGQVSIRTEPTLRLSDTDRVVSALNTRFTLDRLKVGIAGSDQNLLELDRLSVDIPHADAWRRRMEVAQVLIDGVRVRVRRAANHTVEWVEATQPPLTPARPAGTALLVFDLVTNAVALLSGSTNAATATINDVTLTNSFLSFLDEVPARPVALDISDIALQARHVSNLPDASPTATLSLRWQTNGSLTVVTRATLSPPSLDTELDLRQLDLTPLGPYLDGLVNLRVLGSELSFQGKSRLEVASGAEPRGTFEGGFSLANLHTVHTREDEKLLRWDMFRIDGIRAELHPLGATIERVELAGSEIWATLNPDGTVNFLTAGNLTHPVVGSTDDAAVQTASAEVQTASDPVVEPETGKSPAPSSFPLPPVQVASVLITNATLHLTDRMSEPDARLTVKPLNGELRNLSTTNLEQADFEFSGELQPAGAFSISGQVRPLDGPEVTRMTLITRGIDLTPTGPYVQRFLGYELERGALSTELSYRLLNRQLQATNRVILDRFTLGAKVDSPDALKVPIKLGLAVLQDREGRIELTVPVNGSLDDPQFEIGKVIGGAFANVFAKVVTSPFGMLGSMFGGKEDELQQVEFRAGQSELPEDQHSRIERLEKIAYERPALTFEISGAADLTKDGAVMKQQRLLEELTGLRDRLIASGDTSLLGDQQPLARSSPSYPRVVAEAYALARGITLPAPPPPAVPEEIQAPPEITAEPTVAESTVERHRTGRFLRGGERMMELSRMRRQSQVESVSGPSPLPAESELGNEPTAALRTPETGSEAPPPALPSLIIMEAFLLDRITIADSDLLQLAKDRAEHVRASLLETGRNDADQLKLKLLNERPPSGTAVRIDLE